MKLIFKNKIDALESELTIKINLIPKNYIYAPELTINYKQDKTLNSFKGLVISAEELRESMGKGEYLALVRSILIALGINENTQNLFKDPERTDR
jgi:hypothetical protein